MFIDNVHSSLIKSDDGAIFGRIRIPSRCGIYYLESVLLILVENDACLKPYRLAEIIIAKCVFYGCYKVVRVQVYHERPIRQVLGHFNSKSITWCFACLIGNRIWQIINTEIYFVNKPHVLGSYRNFELSIGCISARTAPRYYPSHRQLGIGRIADTAGHTFFVVQHFLGLIRIGTVWWERLLFQE